MEEWHLYTILWNMESIVFQIDGETVAEYTETQNFPSGAQSFHIWIDNAVYNLKTYNYEFQAIESDAFVFSNFVILQETVN